MVNAQNLRVAYTKRFPIREFQLSCTFLYGSRDIAIIDLRKFVNFPIQICSWRPHRYEK